MGMPAVAVDQEGLHFPRGLMVLVEDQMPSILLDYDLTDAGFAQACHCGLPFIALSGDADVSVEGVGEMPPEKAGMLLTVVALEYLLVGWSDPDGAIPYKKCLMARECRRLKLALIRELLGWARGVSGRMSMAIASQIAI